MSTVTIEIPCLVITDSEDVHRSNIQVRAEHYTPEPDVGFDGGYEIMRATLTVDAKMRAHIGRRCWIKVEGGTPVEVPVTPEAFADNYVAVASDDLDEEISEWLSAQEVSFDRDGDAEIAA